MAASIHGNAGDCTTNLTPTWSSTASYGWNNLFNPMGYKAIRESEPLRVQDDHLAIQDRQLTQFNSYPPNRCTRGRNYLKYKKVKIKETSLPENHASWWKETIQPKSKSITPINLRITKPEVHKNHPYYPTFDSRKLSPPLEIPLKYPYTTELLDLLKLRCTGIILITHVKIHWNHPYSQHF